MSDLINVIGGIRLVACFGHWPFVAMIRMEVVVHVAPEVRWTMKPGPCADEYAAREPFRPIITVGSAGVGWDIVVTVRTHRRDPDIDGHLGLQSRGRHGESDYRYKHGACREKH